VRVKGKIIKTGKKYSGARERSLPCMMMNTMQESEFQITTEDGLTLYGRRWDSPATPSGIVCLVHGLGEHCGRYEHVAQHLNENGWTVIAIDLRGHGRSEGRRGHTPAYRVLMNDLSLLVREAECMYPGRPSYLYGHSMGGNLVLNFALRRTSPINGVIASAPMLRMAFDPPLRKAIMGNIVRNVWSAMQMSSGLDTQNLSRDPDVICAYREDPLVHDRVTMSFFDIRDAGLWALEHARDLTVTALIMHGDADRITSCEASRAFAAVAGSVCTLKIWEGFYHEIHNEPAKERVLVYLTQWLGERPAAPLNRE
jgi:alpha-beta hydrolase superfamily lysophospholipase